MRSHKRLAGLKGASPSRENAGCVSGVSGAPRRPLDLRKKNRLGGVATPTYYNGRTYHSKREALYAARLDIQKHARYARDRVVWWKPQEKVPLVVNGRLICTWICDFLVQYADGRVVYEEVKGHETEVWLVKRKLFEALYPGRALKVIR